MLKPPVGPAVDFFLTIRTATFLPTRLAPLVGPAFLPLGDASCAFLALADAVFAPRRTSHAFGEHRAALGGGLGRLSLHLGFFGGGLLGGLLWGLSWGPSWAAWEEGGGSVSGRPAKLSPIVPIPSGKDRDGGVGKEGPEDLPPSWGWPSSFPQPQPLLGLRFLVSL